MTQELNYGRASARWNIRSMFRRVLILLLVLLAFPIGLAILMSPLGRNLMTPSIERLLADGPGLKLPGTFVQQHRHISGGLDPAGFFLGQASLSDTRAFLDTLKQTHGWKDVTNNPLLPVRPPPAWWSVPNWMNRQSLSNDPLLPGKDLFLIHVNDQTGEIAIEWITF